MFELFTCYDYHQQNNPIAKVDSESNKITFGLLNHLQHFRNSCVSNKDLVFVWMNYNYAILLNNREPVHQILELKKLMRTFLVSHER